MSNVICVAWTITAKTTPRPWVGCSRCGGPRPFRCSGKFRLNANGKRLDAWLVHKCVGCGDTWNYAVVERRAVRDFEPQMLAALETNDAALVRRFAFDVPALRRAAHRVEEFAEVEVRKELLGEATAAARFLEVALVVPAAVSLRLDRLLAVELGLSRSRIAALAYAGHLTASGGLSKPARDGMTVTIDLACEVDVAEATRQLVQRACNLTDAAR